MKTDKPGLPGFSELGRLLPQEEMLEVAHHRSALQIGIPKETTFQETRVALVPEAVSLLVSNGHNVVVETNAGKAANYDDRLYSEAGAQIAYDTKTVFQSHIVLKIAPPSLEEIEMMGKKTTLFSALQMTVQPENYIAKLMSNKVTAVSFDFIKDKAGIFPVVRSMSEIAGNMSILVGSEYLSGFNSGGRAAMLGGISGVPPTEVVIIGAGTVGEYAARAAIGLGASVKVFDNSLYRLRRLQNDLGTRIYTSIIQPTVLAKALKEADLAIGAIRAKEGRTPCVVTEEMVEQMKSGAVIVDVSIDQGGCFETSRVTNHTTPIFKKHGVVHYCVPNIASRVSYTASYALSNIFAPILLKIGESGGIERFLKRDAGVRNGVYIYNGILTNKFIGESLNIPYKDLDLLMAAW
jgi:alanine dehydrogenase